MNDLLAFELPFAWWWIPIIVGILVGLILLWVLTQFIGLWIQAYMSQANVTMWELIGMRFRKVNARTIVDNKIKAVKAGINIKTSELETHYLAGGRVQNVVASLIAADRAQIDLEWKTACAIDLAGRDVLDAIKTSVYPKVIDCPSPSATQDKLDAVAQDGIRLLCKARVTVRTNIKNLVGGATQETVIARVGQAIVSAIGSAETYAKVLKDPDHIAQRALESGLGAGTAYEILSIDIADISVAGVSQEANVGAKLQAEQAEADKRRFQAAAERRAAEARATEAENSALVEANRAKVVEAEATVPLAIAEAFRSGNLGVMDYYRLRNIQADTSMRDAIGGDQEERPDEPKV